MDTNVFGRLIIVDSVPSGESNTAGRLMDDVETHAVAHPPAPAVEYIRVQDRYGFISVLQGCKDEVASGGLIPMLHIECHGNEDGFEFADGSFATWDEIKVPLANLNVETKLNLMVAVSACTGGALAKVVAMRDRAPFWGLIGPTRTVRPFELEQAYRAFYTTLLSTHSAASAVAAMNAKAEKGLFWRTTAQGLFEKAWTRYREEYSTPEAYRVRAERMQHRCRKPGGSAPSVARLQEMLISREPDAFERFRNNYFMLDLYPDHKERFAVQFL